MKHSVVYPLISHPLNPELITGDAVVRFATAAERAGFSGISFTDHPAPSQRWLDGGGHDALDPFAALAFVAAATSRLMLIPHIVVLPYRNPFLVAKVAATIDALSGGRFVLSVATGYLRSEYRALGVDFEQRNALFDESIAVLRGVWSTDEFSYSGGGFEARGVSANPKPRHLPVWVGGNSSLTRQRVAAVGDGWNPFPAPKLLASTARTPPIESLADLAPLVKDLFAKVEEIGRDPRAIDVQFSVVAPGVGHPGFDAGQHRDELAEMAGIGVTWNSVNVPGDSLAGALEAVERYGAEVISP